MRWAAALAVVALAGCQAPVADKAEAVVRKEAVQFAAADGVKLFGEYTEPADARALILLFHQADSGQGEYLTIVPALTSKGFATLTLDQRSGGDLYGGNWTVKALGRSTGYAEAKPDLEAALGWAKARKLPVLLWGSSYSASLAMMVAAERPGVAGVLAFSPGEYFDSKAEVREAAAKLRVPLFVASANDAEEVAAAKALFDAAPAELKMRYEPRKPTPHGSSALNPEKSPEGAEPMWKAVGQFLDAAVPPAQP
jgi:alpha-beta hydrolase superfamily lysophospholipase